MAPTANMYIVNCVDFEKQWCFDCRAINVWETRAYSMPEINGTKKMITQTNNYGICKPRTSILGMVYSVVLRFALG